MIAGRTPAAATEELRSALQQIVSCVTPAVLRVATDALETKHNMSSRLARAGSRASMTLTIRHAAGLIHDATGGDTGWQARTTGYMYTLDDADGREILAYHWHPHGRSPETEPHLHLGAGAGTIRPELTRAHLATGFVTPVAMVRLVVMHFGVRPRRADWAERLERVNQTLAMS
jgi:hypothetical protein